MHFYELCHAYRDKPIIIDDTDEIMDDKRCRGFIKVLTETESTRSLTWDTDTTRLSAPPDFETSSPVCVIANAWDEKDHIYRCGIESRAFFIYFNPDWEEVYKYVGEWFWDQEIMDFVHARLMTLGPPDVPFS